MGIDRSTLVAWGVGLALLIAAPFVGLYPIFMMKALCFAIFACAFNLLLGYTGLLSFGHAAYLGAAAYGTGWLIKSAGWSPELGVLAGTLFAAAIGAAGESAFGLQAGIFTNDLRAVDRAFDRIEVGALIVNDVPTFRVDHMPYGGVKQSGFGREGLRYAIEEMTELKLVVV